MGGSNRPDRLAKLATKIIPEKKSNCTPKPDYLISDILLFHEFFGKLV